MDKRWIAGGVLVLGLGGWWALKEAGEPEQRDLVESEPAQPVAEEVVPPESTPSSQPQTTLAPPRPALPPRDELSHGEQFAAMCYPGTAPDNPDRVALAELIDRRTADDEESERRVAELQLHFVRTDPGGCAARQWLVPVMDPATLATVLDLYESYAAAPDAPAPVLEAYAGLVTLSNPDQAIELYGRLQEMEPENPRWLDREAHLHLLDIRGIEKAGGDPAEAAARAREAYGTALTLADEGMERWNLLGKAIPTAAKAGDLERAEQWGRELLENVPDDMTHPRWTAHEGLGLAALQRGDAEGAIAELLQMADVPPGPVQVSFGPSMDLANQLLQAGHTDAVIAYLEKVATFWKPDGVAVWLEALRAGEAVTLNQYRVPEG